MQLQGTITSIIPDGGYQSQNGYINTFMMSINTPTGLYTGQIGSKTQVYPLVVGQPIIVEMSESNKGMRFTKVNPKFAGAAPKQQYTPPLPQQTQGAKFPQAALDNLHSQTGQTQQPVVQGNQINTSIEKQCSLKAAVEYLKGRAETTPDEAVVIAWKFYTEFIAAESQF